MSKPYTYTGDMLETGTSDKGDSLVTLSLNWSGFECAADAEEFAGLVGDRLPAFLRAVRRSAGTRGFGEMKGGWSG